MSSRLPPSGIKGRGALSNPANRFDKAHVETVDDGWFQEEPADAFETELIIDRSRSVIARNDSPDIGFDQSINPYRGCEHGCVFCMAGDTPVLMADGNLRSLDQLQVGDEIYGTVRSGSYRRYTRTRVLARWSVVKPAWRVTLEDGTVVVAGGDHRFLTERGWKFVTGTEQGLGRRPHLTTGNKLMGIGGFAKTVEKDTDYRLGYLTGLVRGDGMLGEFSYPDRKGSGTRKQFQFRLALCDQEALDRAQHWLSDFDVETRRFEFYAGGVNHRRAEAIRTHARGNVERVRSLVAWPVDATRSWLAGFLAGIFDAEGSCSGGILRIPNTDAQIIGWISTALKKWEFDFVVEEPKRYGTRPIKVVRLLGGMRAHLRFFHTLDPAITRKRDIAGQCVKSTARLGIRAIEPLGTMRLHDITTGTEDFIANGVVSHNCYARPSHAYLGLSPGIDFETRLVYKPDAAALLREELSRPTYACKYIMLGSNTDPYQPVERQLRVTRSILEVLAETRHPVAITTRSVLLLRDLDLLSQMAAQNLVSVVLSMTTLDSDLKRKLEPRSASAAARLHAIRALRDAGVPVGVLAAPIIPAVNDSELETILERIAAAGATEAGYVLLRLPLEVADLFRQWLNTHMPDRAEHVMSLVQGTRGGQDNSARFGERMRGTGVWAQLLRDRFRLACRRLGLSTGSRVELDATQFRPPSRGGQMGLGF